MSAEEMDSPVTNFYEGAHVLITGGTGFMGRILLEKLLRSCPKIEKIYLVIRMKKEKSPEQRLSELLNNEVFGRLKAESPKIGQKIALIAGDSSQLNLGISDKDRQLLISKVTHVFHVAATVRFDEKIAYAFKVNVQGVREIITLCKQCVNLKSVIHVSTAYSNCPQKFIDEKFYPAPISGEKSLEFITCLSEDQLNAITPSLIEPWPNTYSYSKSIAEDVVRKFGKGLPIGIVRPSIVIGCFREPIPGWIDNIYGPTGVVAGAGAGLMRTMWANPYNIADLVPVDMSINSIICASWKVASLKAEAQKAPIGNSESTEDVIQEEIPIFNFVASKENSVVWNDFDKAIHRERFRIPTVKAIWFPTFVTTTSWHLYKLIIFFYNTLPAHIFDFLMVVTGRKPQLVEGFRKIHKFEKVLQYFSLGAWDFGNKNTLSLWDSLSPKDKQIFFFDMNAIDWPTFFEINMNAIRLYIFKDDPSTVPAAKRRMYIFCVAHYVVMALLFMLMTWILSFIASPFLPESWN